MNDEAAHNRSTSKQVQDMITGFKLRMGYNNFVILNALRRLEGGVDAAQQAAAENAEQAAEVEQQPPPPTSGSDTAVRRNSKQHPQQEQRFPPGI